MKHARALDALAIMHTIDEANCHNAALRAPDELAERQAGLVALQASIDVLRADQSADPADAEAELRRVVRERDQLNLALMELSRRNIALSDKVEELRAEVGRLIAEDAHQLALENDELRVQIEQLRREKGATE